MLLSFFRVKAKLFSITTIIICAFYVLIIFQYTKPEPENSTLQHKFQHKTLKNLSLTNRKLNWIVVTSINPPTKEIARLAKQKHYQLLVVGDKKSPQNWSWPNAIFLSTSEQEELGYSILESTPTNSYNRKNIGYLFALQNGAQFIYDTDDDNAPIVDLIDYFDLGEYDYGLVLTGLENDNASTSVYVNPYSHFGQPTIWPRGLPLSEINKPIEVCVN